MIRPQNGLWIQTPEWNDYARTFHWQLDTEIGPRSGTLEQFTVEVRELVERDLADIAQICGEQARELSAAGGER
jgi:hypothetical protein